MVEHHVFFLLLVPRKQVQNFVRDFVKKDASWEITPLSSAVPLNSASLLFGQQDGGEHSLTLTIVFGSRDTWG